MTTIFRRAIIPAMPQTIITRNPQKPIFTRSASEFLVKSELDSPIHGLSLLRRGLLFAELSLFSYLSDAPLAELARQLNFDIENSFQSHHGRAFVLRSPQDVVLVFRGSGERDWEELQGEQKKLATFAETIGKVHRCFKEDVDELWPQIEKSLEANRLPVWFCGHSLGGAFANICAQRCLLSYIRSEPEELHTFGSPRIGNKKYVQLVELKHYRWVNNNDFVTRIPAAWWGYRHSGTEMYLDRQGELKQITGWRRASDRIQGAWRSLLKRKLDHVSDHSILQYVDRIFDLVRAENPITPATNRAAHAAAATSSANPSPDGTHVLHPHHAANSAAKQTSI